MHIIHQTEEYYRPTKNGGYSRRKKKTLILKSKGVRRIGKFLGALADKIKEFFNN